MERVLAYFEIYGTLFVIVASLFAIIASSRVNATFKRYGNQISSSGITGAEAARRVLYEHGVTDVAIQRTAGHLTDHYDPVKKTIFLSQGVHDSASTAAIGVAAHEAGHAVQHATGYLPIRIRSAIVPVTNIGSRLSMPLILIGLLLSYSMQFPFGYEIALFGVLCFSLCVIFQLVTLPTEFDASRRALACLENGILLDDQEIRGAKKTLRAAAMTYVAALAVSLMQFLRLFAMVSGGRRRR